MTAGLSDSSVSSDTTERDRATEAKDAATSAASDVATSAQRQAASVVESSKEQAATVMRDAKAHAQDLVGQSRDQLRSQASDQLQSVSQTIQQIADQLTGLAQGDPQPGMVLDVTNQLATGVKQVADRLDEGGLDGALDEVKGFARRKPGAFLLGSLAAGLVAGRVLRSADTKQLMQTAKDAASPSAESTQQLAGPQQQISSGTGALPGPTSAGSAR